MKGYLVTNPGIEDVALLEINELISCKGSVAAPGVVVFDAQDMKQIAKLCYLSQTAWDVGVFLCQAEFSSFNDIFTSLEKALPPLSAWLPKGKTFAVAATKLHKHDFASQDAEKEVADAIHGWATKEYGSVSVNLSKPDVLFQAVVCEKQLFLGIDFAGFDLSKRDYKLFSAPLTLKGTVAYAMARYAGFDGKGVFLDPFCGSGPIPIEAAAFASGKSVRFHQKEKFQFLKYRVAPEVFSEFDKGIKKPSSSIYGFDFLHRHVDAAKRNAKVGEYLDYMTISRLDMYYLDTKFEESAVDCIATHPPYYSNATDMKKIDKLYEQFFFIGQDILKPGRRMVLFVPDVSRIRESAEKQHFVLDSVKKVHTENNVFDAAVFVNGKKSENKK